MHFEAISQRKFFHINETQSKIYCFIKGKTKTNNSFFTTITLAKVLYFG